MQDFRNLDVWRKAHELALATYGATSAFPAAERFGLTNQMRRAAVSIASNIAEGCGRDPQPDLCRFLQIAMGSASELHSQLLLAGDLKFLTATQLASIEPEIERTKRMLSALIVRIRHPRKTVNREP